MASSSSPPGFSLAPANAIGLFVDKLERRCSLSESDKAALLALPAFDGLYVAGETVLACGVPALHCGFVAFGFVGEFKPLPHDQRQVVAFHLPGDAMGLQSIFFTTAATSLQAHAYARITWVSHADLLELSFSRPTVSRALWLDTLVDVAVLDERVVNLGGRSAERRLAHFLLEMTARIEAIGDVVDDAFEMPFGQSFLAEALGLSLVHVNKTLRSLREAGYLTIRNRILTLNDRRALAAFCGFDPSYLHLDRAQIRRPSLQT